MVVARAGLDSRMEGLGHLRAVEVVFTTGAVLHKAHELELGAIELGERLGVEAEGFAGQLAQAQAGHAAGGAFEGQFDQVGADADRLKNLSAVVAGEQRDPDLGEDLAQAVFEGLTHVGLNQISGEGGQLAALDVGLHLGLRQPVASRFPGEPGAHGAGAEADQAGQVMGAPALGSVSHQGGLQTQAKVEQVVVHRTHRQQRRDVGGGGGDAPIREHQDLAASAHGGLGLRLEPLHRRRQARGPIGDRHQGGEGAGGDALLRHGGQLGLIEDGAIEMQRGSGRRLGLQR